MKNHLLSILKERPLILDGAMGTMIQGKKPNPLDYKGHLNSSAILNLTRPDIIESIHDEYFQSGSDIVFTNTFTASPVALTEDNLDKEMMAINQTAVTIAMRSAAKYSSEGNLKFVLGELGPTSKLPTLGHISFDELMASYMQQAEVLIKAGVDGIVIVTCQDMLQIKAAAAGAREAMVNSGIELPLIVSVTIEANGKTLLGSDIIAMLTAVEPYNLSLFGMNCATGPMVMREHLRQLQLYSPVPIFCKPNAGIPQNIDGKLRYSMTPQIFVEEIASLIKEFPNIRMIGGCCGTSPEYIKALALQTSKIKDKQEFEPLKFSKWKPRVSSLFSSITLDQEPRPFVVAEQTNANGSKKFKELLEKNDYDAMAMVAKKASQGAHALDLCVAYAGRDESRDMTEFADRVLKNVDIPLMIDSTNPKVVERALSIAPGRCIINSINLEDGGVKAATILKLAKKFGAVVVCLTIDEDGMAKTSVKKVEIAKKLRKICLDAGLRDHDMLYDLLTMTVASGDKELYDSAVQTLEAVKMLKKEMSESRVLLGVSNISYGLTVAARKVVTSVFLSKATHAGVDAAIINPIKILPPSKIVEQERLLAERLLDNTEVSGSPLADILSYFEKNKTVSKIEKNISQDDLTLEQKLHQKIMDGDKTELSSILSEIVKSISGGDIINKILLPAMKEVGALMVKGELPLPFVLQSAEVMKESIDILAPYIKKDENIFRGTIVLATVRGDVHDIGKNLVDIILSNNGYKVINLGIKQHIDNIMKAVAQHNAQAIGLSGLLVSSVEAMKEYLESLKSKGIQIPVLVGGAALTKKTTESLLQTVYDGDVYYCKDAFAGLSAMEAIAKPTKNCL